MSIVRCSKKDALRGYHFRLTLRGTNQFLVGLTVPPGLMSVTSRAGAFALASIFWPFQDPEGAGNRALF